MARCAAVSLGLVDYQEAYSLQRETHSRVASGELDDTLFLAEHPHVYTLGRRGRESDILASSDRLKELGAEVHHIDRGGEVTYHGPGQLVGYPIVDIRRWGGGPLQYVRSLEQVLSATLADFDIRAEKADRPTGVWVGDAKVAAIGVKVGRGTTTHGFALNVVPDLSYFDHIVPCGMPDAQVTSMERLLGEPVDVGTVMPKIAWHFGQVFGVEVYWTELEDLMPLSGHQPQSA